MEKRSEAFLLNLRKKSGNERCADCLHKGLRKFIANPEWASTSFAIFICETCASVHKMLESRISKVKALRLDRWEDDQLLAMESGGNDAAKQKYEQHVPVCYRRPKHKDPSVIIEQWIRAKYDRKEFMDVSKQVYLHGQKTGYLYKRDKREDKFAKRLFVLNEATNTLIYFNKEDAKEPKARLLVDQLNTAIVPEKIGNPNGMQITCETSEGVTRNIFLFAETGQDLIEWYTALRSAKLNRLAIAYPTASISELAASSQLSRDFTIEGWLSKTGPKSGDAFRRRWFTLDGRKLMYHENPMDAHPKGEVYIGTKDKGYIAREGIPASIKDPGYSFTLKTPDRNYYFSAPSEEASIHWLDALIKVTATPMTHQETNNMSRYAK